MFRKDLVIPTVIFLVIVGALMVHLSPGVYCLWLGMQLESKEFALQVAENCSKNYINMHDRDPLKVANQRQKQVLETEIKEIKKRINYWSRLYNYGTNFMMTP